MRALVLAVVLSGCASVTPPATVTDVSVRLRVDLTLDDNGYSGADLAADMVDAAAVWAPFGGRLVIDDTAPMALRCATWPMDSAAATTNAAGVAAYCLYVVNLPRAARQHVLAHELGHAMGLLHVPEPDALMYPDVGRESVPTVTPADAAEWYRTHPSEEN